MKRELHYLSLLTVVLLSASACSMKDRSEVHSVSVKLPSQWANSSTLNILNNNSSSMAISYSMPTSLSSFQCYALNIKGSGINSDPRLGCTDPASGLGILAGFVPVSVGTLEAMVPAGPGRTVELVGIQSSIGCPILDALLASGGVAALNDLGDPYLLGSTTVDIFEDTAVTIYAAFDANAKAFSSCGGGGGNQLRLQVINNSPAIQGNRCTPLGIYANGSSPPDVQPAILSQPTGGGTVAFYQDPSCTSPVSGAVPFPTPPNPNSSYLNFYVKTSALAAGTFDAQPVTLASGWGTPAVTYNIVSERLGITSTPPNPMVETCEMITISNYADTTNTGSGTLGAISLSVHNNSSYNTPSSMSVYTSAACTGAMAPVSVSGGSQTYSLGTIATTSYSFYVKNTAVENVSIGISRNDNTAEPTNTGLYFTAFNISPNPGTITSIPAGGSSFTLNLSTAGITDIKVGGVSCGSQTISGGFVTCGSTPAFAEGSVKAISMVKNAIEYPTGFSVNYGTPPSFGVLSVTANYGVYFSPTAMPVTSAYAYTCLPVGLDGTGLSINSNCEVSGTPTISGSYSASISVNNFYGSDVQFLSILINPPPSFMYPSDPFPNGSVCMTGNGCTWVSPGTYTLNPSPVINLTPALTNATGTTCSYNLVSGSFPVWMSFNPATCQFNGTASGTGSMVIIITVNKSPFAPVQSNNINMNW